MRFNTLRPFGKLVALFSAFGLSVVTGYASDSEYLSVQSRNPFNFQDILEGDSDEVIELTVKLGFPDRDAPEDGYPAVLFVHGAGGPQLHHQTWLDLFSELGMVTAYANHFSPRGKGSAVGSHIQLTGAAMTADAFHILNALAADPRIDASRIAIMGASKGGGVTLYSSWQRLQEIIAPGNRFAAHVALYPTCVYWDKPEATGSPVFVLLGAKDNWTGVDHCKKSVSEFVDAGFTGFKYKVYENALHGFDSGVPERPISNAYSVVNCKFTIDADGADFASGLAMDTPASKRKALGACISRGVTIGGNNEALESAKSDVSDFVRCTLLQTPSGKCDQDGSWTRN